MLGIVKIGLVAVSLTLSSVSFGSDDQKSKANEVVKQCQRDCKSQRDALPYERCMLQCKNIDDKGSRR